MARRTDHTVANNARKQTKTAAKIIPMFEPLEDRRLYSVSLSGGVVNINTGSGNDNIAIEEVAHEQDFDTNMYVTVNGAQTTLLGSQIHSFNINTGAGNDTVDISFCGNSYSVAANLGDGNDKFTLEDDGNEHDCSILGGAGDDTIITAGGNDYIDAGAGNDSVNAGYGDDTVVSGTGLDTVVSGEGTDASVTGNVFNDANQDWTKDNGEKGIANVTVFNDANNNGKLDAGETSTKTNSSGQFTLSGMNPGTLHVREVTPTGYRLIQGTQAHRDLVATAGSSISGADFMLTTRPLITGQVFADTNGNGKKDANEKGLAGVTVYVDLNNDGKYESNENTKVTDANGDFAFAGLNPGSYTIRVKNPTGYAQTTPTGGFHVTVAAGQSVAAGIFGEKQI